MVPATPGSRHVVRLSWLRNVPVTRPGRSRAVTPTELANEPTERAWLRAMPKNDLHLHRPL